MLKPYMERMWQKKRHIYVLLTKFSVTLWLNYNWDTVAIKFVRSSILIASFRKLHRSRSKRIM